MARKKRTASLGAALAQVDPVVTVAPPTSGGGGITAIKAKWDALPQQTKYLVYGGGALVLAAFLFRKKIASGAAGLATVVTVKKALPRASVTRIAKLLPDLTAAMDMAQIDTPLRVAAFLAQLGTESGDLAYFEEIASGDAYEGRCKDLGNCQPGDGRRFKGRGPIQLTGRGNYRKFTQEVGSKYGVDFEKNPELVAEPKWGFMAAAWFWNMRKLNTFADKGDFQAITYRINGGCNGADDRDKKYEFARAALGIEGSPIIRKACQTYVAEVRSAASRARA
jgi:predicted chitinase